MFVVGASVFGTSWVITGSGAENNITGAVVIVALKESLVSISC